MKKRRLSLLSFITILFCGFLLGFFLGRNQNHETVYLSAVSTRAAHNHPTIPAGTDPTQPTVTFPVDLNSADVQQLTALPGIGPTLADRILAYRSSHGPFEKPEELLNVEGIGTGKLEAILDYVITGG